MGQAAEPTLEEQAYAALKEQHAEVAGSLARILGALDIGGDEDGWEEAAVELIGKLLAVAESAQVFMYSTPNSKSDETAAAADLDQALRALDPDEPPTN